MRINQWMCCGGLAVLFALNACTTKSPYSEPLNPKEPERMARHASLPHRLGSQEDMLMKHLAQTGTQVIHEDTRLRLVMPLDANFKSNSAVLNPNLMGILDYVASMLLVHPYSTATIHGNTDSKGPDKVNQALSERRSHAVIAYLESQGIPGNRLYTYGHGENNPKTTNATHTGRLANRRVEVTIHEGRIKMNRYKRPLPPPSIYDPNYTSPHGTGAG